MRTEDTAQPADGCVICGDPVERRRSSSGVQLSVYCRRCRIIQQDNARMGWG